MAATRPLRTGLSKRLQTRRKIAMAAQDVYLEMGHDACTVEDISSRAGVSRATFYTHFNSKIDAFTELWSMHIDDDLTGLFEMLNAVAAEPTRAVVTDWLKRAFDTWQKHGDMLELMTRIVALEPRTTDLLIQRNTAVINQMHNYLDRFDADSRAIARARLSMLVLQLDRLVFLLNRGVLPYDVPTMIAALVDSWIACLSEPGPSIHAAAL